MSEAPLEPSPARKTALLDDLVVQFLERLDGGAALDIDGFCAAHAEHAGELHRRLLALRKAGLLPEQVAREPEARPERMGEFRLLELLGGGGMGVVYKAEQTTLGRRVALKLIRPEQLYFAGARERFRREIEATAKLSHPGVVPVYSFGEEQGVPYFAMELVEGASLSKLLVSLAGRAPETLTGRDLALAFERATGLTIAHDASLFAGSWVNACMRIARDIAAALQHAHERGVLHRDVKPSNVMLTANGTPRLLDFGLAVRQGASRMTRTDSQLGSLPYMAPEQATGGAAVVDATADVYSLGVTLYEMLTLRLPFYAESSDALMLAIVAARHVAPRTLNPSLGLDAETVCLKAMEPDSRRRYASAVEFADDVTRVLELRPIGARRASLALRMRRWAQRSPARAVAIVLACVLVVGGPLGFAFVQRRAAAKERELNQDLRVANQIAGEQRARAERRFEDLRRLSKSLLLDVHDAILPLPGATKVRRDLVDLSMAYLRGLEADAGDDLDLRFELAQGYQRAGDVLGNPGVANLGDYTGALAAFDKSVELLDGLLLVQPANVTWRHTLAWSHLVSAAVLHSLGRDAEIQAHNDAALAIARDLCAGVEVAERDRQLLIQALSDRSDLMLRAGDQGQAVKFTEEAHAVASAWLAANPSSRAAADAYGLTCEGMAYACLARGDCAGASALLDEWHERVLPALGAAEPSTLNTRSLLHVAQTRADVHQNCRDLPAAIASWREALALAEALRAADADDAQAAMQALEMARRLAIALGADGAVDAALTTLRGALEQSHASLERHPLDRALALRAAMLHERIGLILYAADRELPTAEREVQLALDGYTRLRNDHPGEGAYVEPCAIARYQLGRLHRRMADAPDLDAARSREHVNAARASWLAARADAESLSDDRVRGATAKSMLATLTTLLGELGSTVPEHFFPDSPRK